MFEVLFREALTTVMVTQCAVGMVKTVVGRARPNYYEYVGLNPTDAISSFPSGHASSTWCIHTLLVLHVIGAIVHCDVQCGVDSMHCLFGARLWQRMRFVYVLGMFSEHSLKLQDVMSSGKILGTSVFDVFLEDSRNIV